MASLFPDWWIPKLKTKTGYICFTTFRKAECDVVGHHKEFNCVEVTSMSTGLDVRFRRCLSKIQNKADGPAGVARDDPSTLLDGDDEERKFKQHSQKE